MAMLIEIRSNTCSLTYFICRCVKMFQAVETACVCGTCAPRTSRCGRGRDKKKFTKSELGSCNRKATLGMEPWRTHQVNLFVCQHPAKPF